MKNKPLSIRPLTVGEETAVSGGLDAISTIWTWPYWGYPFPLPIFPTPIPVPEPVTPLPYTSVGIDMPVFESFTSWGGGGGAGGGSARYDFMML